MTSPVTQVAVVAVNNASTYGVAHPLAELMGNVRRRLPTKIRRMKLTIMMRVVEKRILNAFGFTAFPPSSECNGLIIAQYGKIFHK